MANYTTNADLIADILFRAGELNDGSSDFAAVSLRYLNRAFQALWSGGSELNPDIHEAWWWLRSDMPGVLTLDTPITDAGTNPRTALVTLSSTMVTLSAAANRDLTGWFIKFAADDLFRVQSHTPGSATLLLDSPYTGETAAASVTTIFKLEYDLATDLMYVLSPMRVYKDGIDFVVGSELYELEQEFPPSLIPNGTPQKFAMVGAQKVRFSHYGSENPTYTRVDYDYLKIQADLENTLQECIVPRQYRKTLCDYALLFLFADKNDGRAGDAGKLAKAGLEAMVKENRTRKGRAQSLSGHISPRATGILGNNNTRGPLRTSSGLIIGW